KRLRSRGKLGEEIRKEREEGNTSQNLIFARASKEYSLNSVAACTNSRASSSRCLHWAESLASCSSSMLPHSINTKALCDIRSRYSRIKWNRLRCQAANSAGDT